MQMSSSDVIIDLLLPLFRWSSGLVSFESLQLNYIIAGRLFPMNSGDLGFYLGVILGIVIYSFFYEQVHRTYALKWYALSAVPFVGYWLLVIRLQRFLFGMENMGLWFIQPVKEIYTLLGIACGGAATFYVLYHLATYLKRTTMIKWLRLTVITFTGTVGLFTLATLLLAGISPAVFVFLGVTSSFGVFVFLIIVTLFFGEIMADLLVSSSLDLD